MKMIKKRIPITPKRIHTKEERLPELIDASWEAISSETVNGGGDAGASATGPDATGGASGRASAMMVGGGDGSGGAGEGGGGGGGDGSGGSEGGDGGWGGEDGGDMGGDGGVGGGGGDGAATISKPTIGGVMLITDTPSATVRAVVLMLASVAEAAEAALAVGRKTRASTLTLAGAMVRPTSVASAKRVSKLDLKPCWSKVLTSPATVKLVIITYWYEAPGEAGDGGSDGGGDGGWGRGGTAGELGGGASQRTPQSSQSVPTAQSV